MGWIIGTIIGAAIWGVIWGFATNAVILNKGYSDNWFWWGFFFWFIAFIVALTKPEYHSNYNHSSSLLNQISQKENDKKIIQNKSLFCIY